VCQKRLFGTYQISRYNSENVLKFNLEKEATFNHRTKNSFTIGIQFTELPL
jgi:hypothetical protein